MRHHNVELALSAFARGEFVVVADDSGRENEGDLIMAAERATPEALAFMNRHTSGLVCVGMTQERLRELELPLMVADNNEAQRTAFTVSVDFRHGTSTGISAADRSATIRAQREDVPGAREVGGPHLRADQRADGGAAVGRGDARARAVTKVYRDGEGRALRFVVVGDHQR